MKKILLAAIMATTVLGLTAQPVSKKGEQYLPEEGDWAIGVDATPFLKYVGNLFTDAENDAPSAGFTNDQFAISVKKFVRGDYAYRGSFRINLLADSYRSFIPEFSTEPTNTTVEDKYSRTFTNAYLSAGVEKRLGNTRVQGLYGVEGFLGFGSEKHKFDYGNAITQENTNPERSEFDLMFQDDPREISNVSESGAFMTEFKKGTEFTVGARLFVGAEIFIFPKWSVGFEYGLGMGYAYRGNSSIIEEQWAVPIGGNSEQFVTTITDEGGSSRFLLDTDNSGGAFYMFFYF